MARVPAAPADALEVFLGPGELYFGAGNTRIRTVLGSCVAIVLWHAGLRAGGMCHFMLPNRPDRPADDEPNGRYADEAMELFHEELRRRRTSPREYRTRLFGAGSMFGEGQGAGAVPARNMAAAHALLQSRGFTIEAQDLGGRGHRNIVFDLWSGDVWVKRSAPPPAWMCEAPP